MKPHVLIVDDEDEFRSQTRWALAGDYEVSEANDRKTALESFKSTLPSVVLLDLGLPPSPNTPDEGLHALSEIIEIDPLAKIVIISGQDEKENALQAVGNGAYDFLTKPVEFDELKFVLKRCIHVNSLEREYREMKEQLLQETFEGMLGNSRPMRSVFEAIRKVATTDAPVLILGESGTGKEMAARAIHERSTRRSGPFIAINCSAIPDTLLESELFGHEKGAFTGAHLQRPGRIESADGGTLFLDEIGEVSASVQVKLLRFLQEQAIEHVGGRQKLTVDVRVIAATNGDLQKAMQEGNFREDFYYRLAVVQIHLPALRDRETDVEFLAQTFLKRFAEQNTKPGLEFSKKALVAIKRHNWPGNVRELQNRIRRAVIMTDGKLISSEDLELDPATSLPPGTSLKEAREELERTMIQSALKKHSGKITSAAADLGISRPTFYELMDKLGLKRTARSQS